MSELVTNKITPSTGSSDTVTLGDSGDTFTIPSGVTMTNSGTATGFGGGKCLAVVQTVLVTQPTSTTNDWVDISGFTVTTGTLASTSSKCLVTVHAHVGQSTSQGIYLRLLRGSTVIYVGTGEAASNSSWNASMIGSYAGATSASIQSDTATFLDSPSSTSAQTYKVQWRTISGTVYLNKDSAGSYGKMPSSIMVMEIGA